MKVHFHKHRLIFKFDAGTSRGVLKMKDTFFIKVSGKNGCMGTGEAGPLPGLSIDDRPDFEKVLNGICEKLSPLRLPESPEEIEPVIRLIPADLPSVRFGIETALLDLVHGGKRLICDNDFYHQGTPVPINGLIWMGDKDFMLKQAREKIDAGFSCLKMKVGAIDFDKECEILAYIRQKCPADKVILRVDANGAFTPEEALDKLKELARFGLHSIEQPLKQGQWDEMAALCHKSPVKVALDEELIGLAQREKKSRLLEKVNPQFIILKPTLLGGLAATAEWIALARKKGIGWWITSALESNIGLNAISQFTASYQVDQHQGLGTGKLYINNISSPLEIHKGFIQYNNKKKWDFNYLMP